MFSGESGYNNRNVRKNKNFCPMSEGHWCLFVMFFESTKVCLNFVLQNVMNCMPNFGGAKNKKITEIGPSYKQKIRFHPFPPK